MSRAVRPALRALCALAAQDPRVGDPPAAGGRNALRVEREGHVLIDLP